MTDLSKTSNQSIFKYFLEDLQKSQTKRFIETGTYLGDLPLSLYDYCSEIITCESDERLSNICQEKFVGKTDKIKFYHSTNCRKLLRGIDLYDTDVLFLDAHSEDQPILDELNIIKNKDIKPIIYIHDFGELLDTSLITQVGKSETMEKTITYNGEENYFSFECPIDKKLYRYRFEFNSGTGFMLNWDLIGDVCNEIYGKNLKTFCGESNTNVGWIRLSNG